MFGDTLDMASLLEVDMKEIIQSEDTLQKSHIQELLSKYKEITLTSIITQFGLGPIFDSYKTGGNVTTLHNAEKGVFSNRADENRYTQVFDRGNYEKDFPKKRKIKFQNSNQIFDDYTGKTLKKDGTTHLDHIVSAKAIHSNNGARLYMDAEQRNEMATSEKNLAWTDSSLNQSKSDKDLEKWMDRENKRSPGKTNAQHYEINREAAIMENTEAKQHIKSTVRKAKTKYYVSNAVSTGMDQGLRMGQKQALGMFIYELQKALIPELIEYFKRFKSYGSVAKRIEEFRDLCQRVHSHVVAKAKDIARAFGEGFVGGFVANIMTILINTFATTAKNMSRMLSDSIHALIKAFKLLVNPPPEMSKSEALLEASKIFTTTVVASAGVIMTEGFAIYLKTTPAAPFAELIAGVLGGILTGIVSVTLVYVIDNFVDVMKNIGQAFNLIKYQLIVGAEEIRKIYLDAVAKIDVEYQLILGRIYLEYENLNKLTDLAYDCSRLAEMQLIASQSLARLNGVKDSEILISVEDIDNFFMN
jgi:hypothetical protein